MTISKELKDKLSERVNLELIENILPFWINNVVDKEYGGFYGQITNELKVDKEAPKGAILNSRILWAYATAYRVLKDKKYLEIARRAYNYILANFWDNSYSGVYWMVDYKGEPIDTKKQIYAQAFTIYGLSEYYRATGDEKSLEKAIEIFKAIEKYSYDNVFKGYFEGCTREWALSEDLRLSTKDMNEKKSMNTHLHILEAYTNLFRVWKNSELKEKLNELIEVTIEHIVDNNNYHFKLFFDEEWKSKTSTISYGHDIEGSWLLLEAAEVLGDEALIKKVKEVAIKMGQATLEEGIDKDGGLLNELHENGVVDKDKHWWPQAEAVVGFLNAYELTGEDYFFDAAYDIWDYIECNIVDKVNGEWFWMAKGENNAHNHLFKVDAWKCPYHNSRACFEILQRLQRLNKV